MFILFLSSCLTVEKKEYTFEFTDKNAGKLTIKYINIMSTMDDTLDVSATDFDELVNTYLNGTSLEDTYPNAKVIDKRLFEENGKLCGEVIIEFKDLKDVKLYQHDPKGPYMMMVGQLMDSESYSSSNGEYGGEEFSVVFWDKSEKVLRLTTMVSEETEDCISLLPHYNDWK